MTEIKLLADGRHDLNRRSYIGERCIALAFDGPWSALEKAPTDDRETYAKDAISDILTALFGPAGTWKMGQGNQPNEFALNEARRVVEEAFRSWEGDAEDYVVEPEPGEYGYEGDES